MTLLYTDHGVSPELEAELHALSQRLDEARAKLQTAESLVDSGQPVLLPSPFPTSSSAKFWWTEFERVGDGTTRFNIASASNSYWVQEVLIERVRPVGIISIGSYENNNIAHFGVPRTYFFLGLGVPPHIFAQWQQPEEGYLEPDPYEDLALRAALPGSIGAPDDIRLNVQIIWRPDTPVDRRCYKGYSVGWFVENWNYNQVDPCSDE